MNRKSVIVPKKNIDSIDYIINEHKKFNWIVEEKKFIDKPSSIEIIFTRSNVSENVLETEKKYILLNDEKEKLRLLQNKLLDNEMHTKSKSILFICFVAFNIFLCILFLFILIDPELELFRRLTYIFGIVMSFFLCYSFFNFLFVNNEKKIKNIEEQIDVIKMKQHNIIIDMN